MKNSSSIIIYLFLFVTFIVSCSHYDQLQKDPKESSSGSDESHNEGKNCGSCHNVSGSEAVKEAGWWTISGSVFSGSSNPQKNAIIEIWEKPGKQGKLIKRLVSDDKGNFYTNQILNFSAGVYPVIIGTDSTIEMKPSFTGGSCNSCHGVTAKILEVK